MEPGLSLASGLRLLRSDQIGAAICPSLAHHRKQLGGRENKGVPATLFVQYQVTTQALLALYLYDAFGGLHP